MRQFTCENRTKVPLKEHPTRSRTSNRTATKIIGDLPPPPPVPSRPVLRACAVARSNRITFHFGFCETGPPRSHDRTRALAGHRRVGARLLPPVQERQARLREVYLQGGELGGRAGEAHGRDVLMMPYISLSTVSAKVTRHR